MAYTANKLPNGLETLTDSTIADADIGIVGDASDSGRAKGITWANLKIAISTYIASFTQTLTNKTISLGSNTVTGTSAQLATAISDETGSGALVFGTSPTLVTPALGTPASGVATNLTGTATGLTAGNATAAVTATHLAGGSGGTIPHQTAAGTTAMLANGTAGKVLTANGTTVAPSWETPATGTPEGTAVLSTGETGGTKFLREDGDGTSSWQAVTAGSVEGTAVVSTGVTASYVLQADGDNTSSWVALAGGGDMVLASVQSVTGKKTYDTTKLAVKGSSTGVTDIASANAGASNYTATLPAATDTLVGKATSDTFTNKTIDASGTGNVITNIGFSELDSQLVYPAWNGWIAASLTSATAAVTSNGTTVTLTVEKSGTGDLDIMFSTGLVTVDCTPALTVALTVGSDIAPQTNYVYILASAPTVLTKSTTGFPTSGEFHPIGTFVIPSAATTQTYGAYKTHLWTDHIQKSGYNGHLAHINEWIRNQPATWIDGAAITPTLTAASPDTLTFATSAGNVYQLHPHAFPAFDSSTAGTTAATTFFAVNHTTAYTAGKDLYNFKLTSAGAAAANNDRISWVIWGVVSESTNDCKVMVNLPSGFYTSDASAISDGSKYANYTIPAAYTGTGFLIAKLTYKYNTTGGGDLTLVENLDLRGQFPTKNAGGTAIQNTVFADNAFKIYDNLDATKIVDFQASGITTGTTRTLTIPDASGTLVTGGGTASGTNTGDNAANSTADMLLGTVQSVTAEKKFTNSKLTILGSSTGKNTFTMANSSASDYVTTVPAVTGTLAIASEVLALAGGTMTGDITLGENTAINLDPAGSADGKYSGICISGVAGETVAFGDLMYLKAADSRFWLTDADASATGGPVMIGMCVVGGNAAATIKVLLLGQIRADAKFPALTIGAPAYLGETAGAIQVAIPTGADNVIRVVGFALTADEIYFNPSQDHQLSVA